jgi:cyclopropane-fatty-acyl-phospholipid synthase
MQDETMVRGGWSPVNALRVWRDRLLLSMCSAATRGVDQGRLRLTLPSGASAIIGRGGSVESHLYLRNFALFGKTIRRGTVGFADAYMAGDIHSPAIGDVLRFFIHNNAQLKASGRGLFRISKVDTNFHQRRANSRDGSKRNIAAHYDLGNAFYATWLDRTMTYSSARFTSAGVSLEAAQAEKNSRILQAMGVKAGDRVLEIGCGWGGFAEAAAAAGAHVTGLTISAEQLAYAKTRIANAGHADRCNIRFQDYRDVTGTYDAIASIEMIEAVGEENWPGYFRTIYDRLKPGGAAVIQAITIAPEHFESYRANPDFIQRYIFPGGMLPTVPAMAAHAEKVGLSLETVDRFGADYVTTLQAWTASFDKAWAQIAPMGFDEQFRRMWLYYLVYCEVAFATGVIDVGHYRLVKPATNRTQSSQPIGSLTCSRE